MDKKPSSFFHDSFAEFNEALLNVGMFLPYFFSVKQLLKTLFQPWKNLTQPKTGRGFSFQEWFNRLGFNVVSRTMGFIMRSAIITAFLGTMVMYVLALPIIFITYFALLPFIFLMKASEKSPEEKKVDLKDKFIAKHMLNQDNFQEVEIWFERLYEQYFANKQWWKMENLMANPPLARDWAMGYTPTLDEYTMELTNGAYQNGIKHIVGRSKEIDQIERILSKSEEANVLLVGEDGVGRHTVIDALAKRIYEGKTNPLLMYRRVLRVSMEKILTQALDHNQREEFLEELIAEAAQAKNVILIIDNFDKYVSSGEDRVDMTIPFERFAKASVQIIGVTSAYLYEKYIRPNEKINRVFSRVDINEVNRDEALLILLDTAIQFEQRFHVFIPYETVKQAVDKSDFFVTSMPFPEKATQALDNACVYTTQTLNKNVVFPDAVDITITEKTHVPTQLTANLKDKLLKIEQLLRSRIVSQHEAIDEIASALRRSFLLIGKRKKPLATFLFLGPTGVGKTETAKAIAEVFFESQANMIRFDMSAYQTKFSIPELVGSMETANPGLLTQAVREHPYGVLLLDEIEKAEQDLLNIFLTQLDEGYFTEGTGKRVDCKNLVIVATSNAGSDYIYEQLSANNNYGSAGVFSQKLIHHLIEKHIFTPEFLNRFDGVVAYSPLRDQAIVSVAHKFLDSVIEQIFTIHKIKVVVSESTLKNLTEKSYDPAFGARDMERILRQEIEDKIARMIFEGKAKEGDVINL